jgi:aminoglycoside phosphotransferase (APT) family kinase protein
VPADSSPLSLDQHTRFLSHLAAFHAATWGWSDDIGLLPLGNRYLFFGPRALECEAALGFPAPVPRIASEGWDRLASVAPDTHAALAPLLATPWPLVEALDDAPHAFLHGDWKLGNLGSDADGRTILVDWSLPGSGPPLAELAHYLALNRARLPEGHTKEDAIDVYRGALEGEGVATDAWWDRQLALSLLAVMVLLGWEKAFDDTGVELAWWSARVRDGLDYL